MRFAQEVKPASWLVLSAYMVLSFYNFHERSELTSILTSILTSETSVRLIGTGHTR